MALPATIPTYAGRGRYANLVTFRRDPIAMLLDVSRELPDIARVPFGVMQPILLGNPELIHAVLVDEAEAFSKSFGLSLFARPLLGRGLLTLEGDRHRKRRRLAAPAFMPKRVATYADEIARRAERSAERLAHARELDIAGECMRLTLEIVIKTLFDAEVTGASETVERALPLAMSAIIASTTSALPLPPPLPTPANLRLARATKSLDAIIFRIIREHRQGGGNADDLLSMLLAARDEEDGSALSDRELRDELMTLMLAGHETTANALAWSLYALAREPGLRAQLLVEVDRVSAPVLSAADLRALPLTLGVVKEAMRLYPPVHMIARRVLRDVDIGPYKLARGTLVFVNIIGMHRRADLFVDPLRFDPERFSPAREKQLPRYAYLPFSGGPRVCIGNHFALMEAHLILATWLRRVEFEAIDPRPAEFDAQITLRPRGGLRMRVRARSRGASAAIGGEVR